MEREGVRGLSHRWWCVLLISNQTREDADVVYGGERASFVPGAASSENYRRRKRPPRSACCVRGFHLAGLDHAHVGGGEGGGELAVHLLVSVDAAGLELARDAALRAGVAAAHAEAVAEAVLLGDAELGLELLLLRADAAARGEDRGRRVAAREVREARAGGAVV